MCARSGSRANSTNVWQTWNVCGCSDISVAYFNIQKLCDCVECLLCWGSWLEPFGEQGHFLPIFFCQMRLMHPVEDRAPNDLMMLCYALFICQTHFDFCTVCTQYRLLRVQIHCRDVKHGLGLDCAGWSSPAFCKAVSCWNDHTSAQRWNTQSRITIASGGRLHVIGIYAFSSHFPQLRPHQEARFIRH